MSSDWPKGIVVDDDRDEDRDRERDRAGDPSGHPEAAQQHEQRDQRQRREDRRRPSESLTGSKTCSYTRSSLSRSDGGVTHVSENKSASSIWVRERNATTADRLGIRGAEHRRRGPQRDRPDRQARGRHRRLLGHRARDHAGARRRRRRGRRARAAAATPPSEALDGIDGVEVDELDLGDLDSVRAFAERFLDAGRSDRHPDQQRRRSWPARRRASGRAGRRSSRPTTSATSRSSTGSGRRSARRRRPRGRGVIERPPQLGDPLGRPAVRARLREVGRRTGRRRRPTCCSPSSSTRSAQDARRARVRGAPGRHPDAAAAPPRQARRWSRCGWIDEDGNPRASSRRREQGAATQVWAATSPQLDGMGGVYCEDCDIAEPMPADEQDRREGVARTRSIPSRPRGCGRSPRS